MGYSQVLRTSDDKSGHVCEEEEGNEGGGGGGGGGGGR